MTRLREKKSQRVKNSSNEDDSNSSESSSGESEDADADTDAAEQYDLKSFSDNKEKQCWQWCTN